MHIHIMDTRLNNEKNMNKIEGKKGNVNTGI